jgi:hypothetical protein
MDKKITSISIDLEFDTPSWEKYEKVDYIVTHHYKEADEGEVKKFTWTLNFDDCLQLLDSIEDSYVLVKSLDKFKSAIWYSDADKDLIDKQLEKLANFRKEKIVGFADLQGDRHIQEVSFKDCFEYDDYNYPYGYSVIFTDGSVLEKKNVSLRECILVMKQSSKDIPHKLHTIKEELENIIFKVYNHDVNTRYRWRREDLGEVEGAYSALPVFPYSYEMGFYRNKYVICKSAITGEVLWEKADQCANGLIEIAQKDPDNYTHCVQALKDAVDKIYEEPYRTYSLESIEKAEATVASLKEKSEAEKAARPVFTEEDIDIATLDDTYTYDVEHPGFYGDVYYHFGFPKEARHNLRIGYESKKTTDFKDFEPLFDKILGVSGGDNKLVVKLCQPDDFGFFTGGSYSDTCNRMEMIYLRAKYAKTRMECKNLSVEINPFCKPVIEYNGEKIGYSDLFFYIPLEERHTCFLQVIKELRKLSPDSIVYWFPRFEALYKESIAEGFANLDRELLKFSVDEVKSFTEASTWSENWVSYTNIDIVGSLELNGEKITSKALYDLYKSIDRDKFWGIYNSISLLSKCVDKKVFAEFPKMIVEPLTWAPEGVIKIEKPEFTGYLENVTSKGSFKYRLVNCDPVSSAEVTLEFVLNLFSEEVIEAASEFTLKSGWDGILVRDRDWSTGINPEVFGTLTKWSTGSGSNSKMFFLPYVIIQYRGWKYLQSRGWNESDEVRIHKKETAYLDSYGVLRVLRNKQMEATMESQINKWIRDSKPDKSYSSDPYMSVMDSQTWKNVKGLLNENLFTCIADRFNYAKIWYNIVKEVCDGRDLYWDLTEFKKKYEAWYESCTSFDFSNRTICYKRVMDGKIIEDTRTIKISPADRVRDLIDLGRTREDALGVVMPLWHRYKFEFQVSMEFTEEIDFEGKMINVRKKPVKVNIPKFIEVPASYFYGGNLDCAFADGSMFYLCSSLLKLTSYTKLSEFYEMVKQHVNADGKPTEVTDYSTAESGYFRLEVNQEKIHRFLINHSIWHLNNSHVAEAKTVYKTDGEHTWAEKDVRITNPRSVEVTHLVDFDKGWGSDDKLRFWDRAFTMCDHPVVLSFPSREVMRITE